jgi:hypothetical protein
MKKENYAQLERMIDLLANEKKVNLRKLSDELDSLFYNIVKEELK